MYFFEARTEDHDENASGEDDQFPYDFSSLYTDEVFDSREGLVHWAKETCRTLGYVLVTKRSSKNTDGQVNRVVLKCDRGGVYKGVGSAGKRSTGSKRMGCRFQLEGHYYVDSGWRSFVREYRHNHEAAGQMEGHAYARRLTDQEKLFIERADRMDMKPRQINKALKDEFPENISVRKDIYNLLEALREKEVEQVGGTPTQAVLTMLLKRGYVHEFTENPGTCRMENLFFMHPMSYQMFRAFPTVIFIDATYKTNVYNMPFVEVVGVTSTGKTFCIACAFLTDEKGVNYVWLLQCLKRTLMGVRVIVTDKDQALINACKKVYPLAGRILCRFHIRKNLEENCQKHIKDEREWGRFIHFWGVLVQSRTLEAFVKNKSDLKVFCQNYPGVFRYLDQNWLSDECRKSVVSLWVDVFPNFGNYTTNRVESEHSLLKSYLNGKASLPRFVECIDQIVSAQVTEIKQSFERSRIVRQHKHNIHILRKLQGFVSHDALDIILTEYTRLDENLKADYSRCGCKVLRSCDLPCSCRLGYYEHYGHSVPLDKVNEFWKKLDFSPAASIDEDEVVPETEELSFDEQVHSLRSAYEKQPPPVKRSWLKRIGDIFNPRHSNVKVPAKQTNTRGRPSKAKGNNVIPDLNKAPGRHSTSSARPSVLNRTTSMHAPSRHSSYQTETAIERSNSSLCGFDVGSTSEYYQSEQPFMDTQYSQCQSERPFMDSFAAQYPPPPFLDTQYSQYPPPRHTENISNRNNRPRGDTEYLRFIPELLRPYVSRIKNVVGDGNCGFRAFAEAMEHNEHEYFEWVRMQMAEEYEVHQYWYDLAFAARDRIGENLQLSQTPRHKRHWMQTPEAGVIVANRFECVVHCLDNQRGSVTCLPMFVSEEISQPHQIYTILNVGDHFLMVELEGNYPMPPITAYWTTKHLPCSDGWEVMYRECFEEWMRITRRPTMYCNIPSDSGAED